MKQTNEKYINREMALMAALTTESLLLHQGYDAMLYWHASMKSYVIAVEYVNDNPTEKYNNYQCSYWIERIDEGDTTTKVVLYFAY